MDLRTYGDVVENVVDLTKDYINDCQYRSSAELTLEDLEYIATECQLGLIETIDIIREHV